MCFYNCVRANKLKLILKITKKIFFIICFLKEKIVMNKINNCFGNSNTEIQEDVLMILILASVLILLA